MFGYCRGQPPNTARLIFQDIFSTHFPVKALAQKVLQCQGLFHYNGHINGLYTLSLCLHSSERLLVIGFCFCSWFQVVDKVRTGSGKDKKILVIDIQTEDDMKSKGEAIDPDNSIVMIPRKVSVFAPMQPPVSAGGGAWDRKGMSECVGCG